MAEFIMKDLVSHVDLLEITVIDSAAVSREELGNDMYPPAKRILSEHGVPFSPIHARQIDESDLQEYNRIIVMDRSNLRIMRQMFGDKCLEKTELLMSLTGKDRDVEDPWYTGDFERAYRDILEGCQALLRQLTD